MKVTLTLDVAGRRLCLQDHAAAALTQLAAQRDTVASAALAAVLGAHLESNSEGPLSLDRSQQHALMSVLVLVPADGARPELRHELSALRGALEATFEPDLP